MARRLIFLCFFLPAYFALFAQEVTLEPLVIERSRYSLSLKDYEYFSFDQKSPFVISSIEEVIDYSSSIDLRKRSAFGIQQDISLRGSIFEDTTVSLAGIDISDPQTGHFTLELPLTSVDIESAHILKNSQSIAFLLKKPQPSGGIVAVSFGEHALWQELASVNFGMGQLATRVSIEHKSSSGDRQDRDFEIYNFSSHSLWQGEQNEVELVFGSTIRDFGAGNFYTTAFPHQEEHITQQFYLARAGLKEDSFDYNATLYLRRHTDKFILNRHNPSFYTNNHTSYVYGLRNDIDFPNKVFVSFDIERETIKSTNLNNHRRLRKGISVGIKQKRLGDFIFDMAAGFDYYGRWEYVDNGHIGLGYFLADTAKLRFSFDRIWRPPSFTELYYVSPSNIGNSALGVQRSNNYELGMDVSAGGGLEVSVSAFLRDQSHTIDWVKNISTNPWQAENVGTLKAYGFDVYSSVSLKQNFLKDVSLGYTYLELDKDSPYVFSKYVFDYNRHNLVAAFGCKLGGFSLNTIVNFSKPLSRKKYTSVDFKATKTIGGLSLSLEGTNIFNVGYEELTDISGQGRWYRLSLSWNF